MMPETLQLDFVLEKGEFIYSLVFPQYKTALYSLDTFFVEIRYSFKGHTFIGLTSFSEGILLNIYKTAIKLELGE